MCPWRREHPSSEPATPIRAEALLIHEMLLEQTLRLVYTFLGQHYRLRLRHRVVNEAALVQTIQDIPIMALPCSPAVLVLERRQVKERQRHLVHLAFVDLHNRFLTNATACGLPSSQCCGSGGRCHGQEKNPAKLSSQNPPPARP